MWACLPSVILPRKDLVKRKVGDRVITQQEALKLCRNFAEVTCCQVGLFVSGQRVDIELESF